MILEIVRTSQSVHQDIFVDDNRFALITDEIICILPDAYDQITFKFLIHFMVHDFKRSNFDGMKK